MNESTNIHEYLFTVMALLAGVRVCDRVLLLHPEVVLVQLVPVVPLGEPVFLVVVVGEVVDTAPVPAPGL